MAWNKSIQLLSSLIRLKSACAWPSLAAPGINLLWKSKGVGRRRKKEGRRRNLFLSVHSMRAEAKSKVYCINLNSMSMGWSRLEPNPGMVHVDHPRIRLQILYTLTNFVYFVTYNPGIVNADHPRIRF